MAYVITRTGPHGKSWFLGDLGLPGFGSSPQWGPGDMGSKVFTAKHEAERVAREVRGTVEKVEDE